MPNDDLARQTEAAEAYEAVLVPALMKPWAARVADAARVARGEVILDVACGTGIVAREVASRLGSDAKVSGVDATPGMLAVARRLAPKVAWHAGTAEALPFPDTSFDVVLCQFGLMFFDDRALALREMSRVLVPGGRLTIAVWDSLERTPAYATEAAVIERLASPQAAAPIRAPFVLGDPEALAAMIQAAGLVDVEVARISNQARFPNVRIMVEADLRGWLPMLGIVLGEDKIGEILAEAERALAHYIADDGSIVFESPALVATGKRL